MDIHTITLVYANGDRWQATVSDLDTAESIFSRWGSAAHTHGDPLYIQHIVSTLNGTSRVEYCERSVTW